MQFHELIKNFERVREYMRQFFIYGYKVRNEYTAKSARTYDNEKRRIESYLGDYVKEEYTSKGKQVFISVDSKKISQNPLYVAWKAKSFTDNDIMLHFFLLDILWDGQKRDINEITDVIAAEYGVVFDTQTVRLKLKEYEQEELVTSSHSGKSVFYQIETRLDMENDALYCKILEAMKLFQETSAFGFVGSTILDREQMRNDIFYFKNHYIVHTLEDGILYDIITAMREKRLISFENKSVRTGRISYIKGLPLRIFVSTQTGRRYVCLYLQEKKRFVNMRLDAINSVKLLEVVSDYEKIKQALCRNQDRCWGVSFGTNHCLEEIYVKLYIDEKKEKYVIDRLKQEGRGGEVVRLKENLYLYSGAFFDTNEMLPWIKTFTGRIVDIQGSNSYVISKINHDLDRMYEMYQTHEEGNEKT